MNNKILDEKLSVTMCIMLIIVLQFIAWRLFGITFQTNEDKIFMNITAGYMTGSPNANVVFGCAYWYGIISFMYSVWPLMPWYTIVQLVILIGSSLIICGCFLHFKRGSAIQIGFVISVFIFSMLYFNCDIQFTVTAAIVGAAAIVLDITNKYVGESRRRYVVVILLAILSYGIRKEFGLITFFILFFTNSLEIFGLGNRRKRVNRIIIMLLLFFCIIVTNYGYERASGIAEYQEYWNSVEKWIDYPHNGYDVDIDIYNKAGWDDTLYNMATHWFFMDENINKDSLNVINSSKVNLGSKELIKRKASVAKYFIGSNNLCNIQLIMWLIVMVFISLKDNRQIMEKNKRNTVIGLFVGFCLISLYFLYAGRYPMRVYQALLDLFFLPSMLIVIKSFEYTKNRNIIQKICLVIFVCSLVSPKTNVLSALANRNTMYCGELEQYAIRNDDKLFIYDDTLVDLSNPFMVYEENNMPTNLLFWGGWIYNTPMYWEQLTINNKTRLGIEDFVSDNVLFCGVDVSEDLVSYIQKRRPDAKVVIYDKLDGAVIYRFVSSNEE